MIVKVNIIIKLENYDSALDYLDKIKDLNKKFELTMEYGQKFLNESSVKMQKFIKNFVTQILGQNKNKNEPLIKYENLIKIYLNQEALLEELLDFILEKDDSCDSSIIHR